MQPGEGHGEKRTRKQEQLIAALLSHPTIEAPAKSVGISDATAWRWMKTPEFQAAYRESRREAMRHTTARLQEAAAEAVDALREVQRERRKRIGSRERGQNDLGAGRQSDWIWKIYKCAWKS
jgi:hypothetical protein